MSRVYIALFISIVSLTSFQSSQAGVWDCFKLFKKSPPRLLRGLSDHKLNIIKKINTLDEIEFSYRGKKILGTVTYFDFEKLILVDNFDKSFKLSKIKDLKMVSASKLRANGILKKTNRIKNFVHQKLKEQEYLKSLNLDKFHGLSVDQQKLQNQKLAKKLEDLIFKKYQTRNIGFHFNLNGGLAIDYVSAGGIKANRGADIGVQFGDRTAEVREQVYFFSMKNMSLYEIVNMDNMKSIFSKNDRMGDTVNIFNLDHVFFKRGIEAKVIEPGEIYYTFDERWMRQNKLGQIGIPYGTYLMPPLEVYKYKNIGLSKLSREVENFLVLKQIEYYLRNSSRGFQ